MPMGLTAEIVAERYKVTREEQDEYALASQQRTAAFQQSGKHKDEIVADDGQDAGDRQGDRRRRREKEVTVDTRRVQPSRDHRRGPREAAPALQGDAAA